MMPKAAVINDLSGFGRCSLTAAISVIAAMGVQPVPMPTAVLTAQTGFDSYYCDNFTDRMPHFTEEWKKMQASFDGIYIGFLLDERQIDVIHEFLETFYREKTILMVDPIMGDDGLLYDIYSPGLGGKIRSLSEEADLLTPNLTELSLLAEEDFHRFLGMNQEPERMFEEIGKAGANLLNKEGKQIVVTGIRHKEPESGNEMMTNLVIQKKNILPLTFPCHPGSYSGTGDLMASVLMAGLLRGDTLAETVSLAGTFLDTAIAQAAAEKMPHNDGVPYEQYLSMLWRK